MSKSKAAPPAPVSCAVCESPQLANINQLLRLNAGARIVNAVLAMLGAETVENGAIVRHRLAHLEGFHRSSEVRA